MSNTTTIMKSLSNALDMPPLVIENNHPLPAIIPGNVVEAIELTEQEKQAEEDFAKSREVLMNIIEQGQEALQGALAVANGSQNPRAYEVCSKIIKDLSEANQGLLALHESRRALTPSKESEKETSANTINNNTIIVSSPVELLDMVYQKRKMQQQLDDESNRTI